MKTHDAFAFRDFDAERILQRNFFDEWRKKNHVDTDDTDEKILATFGVTNGDDATTLEKKNSILRELSAGLSDFYDMIQKHADYRGGRLENYRRAVMKKIVPSDKNATPFQARINREQNLLGFYTSKVLPSINDKLAVVAVTLAQSEKFLQAAYRRRFGARLKQAREKAGMTQKELAEKIGLTAAGFAFYERGERELTILALTRLARILKISTDNLLGLK